MIINHTNEERRFQFSLRYLLLVTLVVGSILGFIVNLPAIASWCYSRWEIGEQFDRRIFEEPSFALRITAFHQRGALMGAPGGFYRYEVKTASDWHWRRIVMFRLGTPEAIPDDHLIGITDSCAYFVHGCILGVTTDGGATWSIKGGVGNSPLYSKQSDVNANIEAVAIGPDGSGTMRLANWDYKNWKRLPSYNLVTSDFGLTWQEP